MVELDGDLEYLLTGWDTCDVLGEISGIADAILAHMLGLDE